MRLQPKILFSMEEKNGGGKKEKHFIRDLSLGSLVISLPLNQLLKYEDLVPEVP